MKSKKIEKTEKLKKHKSSNTRVSHKELHTEEFRTQVLLDYYTSGLTVRAVAAIHNVNVVYIYRWKKRFPPKAEFLRRMDHQPSEVEKPVSLKKAVEQNLELQKKLEFSDLQVKGLERLIEIAEKELNISIVKKSGAKQ